jgi:hypothetical protein
MQQSYWFLHFLRCVGQLERLKKSTDSGGKGVKGEAFCIYNDFYRGGSRELIIM